MNHLAAKNVAKTAMGRVWEVEADGACSEAMRLFIHIAA